MNFLRRALGINNEASVPDAPSKPPLTQQEVDDIVKDFLIEGRPSPTNQQIAEKLGRTIEEVNVLRPPGPYLHTRYDSDGENEAIHYDTEKMEILNPLIGSQGGRKNHKTISNKNKKNYKKLSRRRRHHSKKNRKSMKRK